MSADVVYEDNEFTARVSAKTRYVSMANYVMSTLRKRGKCEIAVMGHAPSWEVMKGLAYIGEILPIKSNFRKVLFILEREDASKRSKAGEKVLVGEDVRRVSEILDNGDLLVSKVVGREDQSFTVPSKDAKVLVDGIVITVEKESRP